MKKEAKADIIKPSDIILQDKIKQRENLRKEFLQQQKEKYKNKANKQDPKDRKKQIISQIKEVYESG